MHLIVVLLPAQRPNICVPTHKIYFFSLSLELSSKLDHFIQLFRRYLKHVAFHALQLSRLSITSMEKLATCIANRLLPADFPPTDFPIQLAKSEAPPSLTKNTVTPNDRTTSTSLALTRASAQSQVVVVSDSAKRLRSESQVPLATTNSQNVHTSSCKFVQIANVSRRIDLAVKKCDRCCSLSSFCVPPYFCSLLLLQFFVIYFVQTSMLRCSICNGEFQ